MTSVVIWRYRENKMNLTFKGGGGGAFGGAYRPPNIMAGETLYLFILKPNFEEHCFLYILNILMFLNTLGFVALH